MRREAEGAVQLDDAPARELLFRRRLRLRESVVELWRYRELVRSLAERELRARYKQAVLGFVWAVVSPVAFMVVFTLFFDRVARVETHGAPYPLFSYVGLVPWAFFSTSVAQGGQSLVANKALLNKVYCPRAVFPVSSVLVAAFDATISATVLGVLFALLGTAPKATALWVPLLLGCQLAFTTGVALALSAAIVYLRDIRHALPLVLQLGLFATPVAYGMDAVPASVRTVYAVVNPLAPVIDGYRRVLLWGQAPDWSLLGPGALSALLVLIAGYVLFQRLETGFADVA